MDFSRPKKAHLEILKNTGYLGAKPVDFSMEHNSQLTPTNLDLLLYPSYYRRLVGCLIYLIVTCPNIVYSVNILCQFMHQSRTAIRILRYLKSAPGKSLLLSANNGLKLYAYYDFDWASCPTTGGLTIGYCIFFDHIPV